MKKLAVLVLLFFGFGAGVASAARYVNNNDGTVTDTETQLMWQRAESGKEKNWKSAVSYCENLTKGGYDDWRLPRVDELRTIVDYTHNDPAIRPVFKTHSAHCWSSSTSTNGPGSAWSVYFSDGVVYDSYKSGSYYVRCVRGGPYWSFDPSDHLEINTENTVKDTLSGYVWQKSDDGKKRQWGMAKKYCKELELDGYTDWRLPTIEELQTIIDYTTQNPALPTEVLDGRSNYYWSNSTYTYDPNYAWGVFFDYGYVGAGDKSSSYYVRCVRGGP